MGSVLYYQTVIPKSLRLPFLELVHSDAAGYLKFSKSVEHAQRRRWWLEWKTKLQIFIQNCSNCAAYHREIHPVRLTLTPCLLVHPCNTGPLI